MRSQDDRAPAYTAAVERSEAAFAAVRAVLGGPARLLGTAGELAELAVALPPETPMLVARWPRIAVGERLAMAGYRPSRQPRRRSAGSRSPRCAITPAVSTT